MSPQHHSTKPDESALASVNGEAGLRALITAFVARLYADPMIGFFFVRVPRKRLLELEFQHAAAHFGGAFVYRGRPMDQAHAAHAIGDGHFSRRLVILAEVLDEAGIAAPVKQAWLAAQERQRAHIVRRSLSAPCPMPR